MINTIGYIAMIGGLLTVIADYLTKWYSGN